MLNINFLRNEETTETKEAFFTAVHFEFLDMNMAILKANIASLATKIANKRGSYTEEEITTFEVEKTKKEQELSAFKEEQEAIKDIYNTVLEGMTAPVGEGGFHNNINTVKTVLRVLASVEDAKLIKQAITPAFKDETLYKALETIHVSSKATEVGNIVQSQAVKDAYKTASAQLENIIKVNFSLPFETPYTVKTRVKLTAEDKKLLNDCYIKGFTNKFTVSEDDVVTFKGRQLNTLVTVKKNSKGEAVYNYSGLASTIASIVMKHYFN